MTQVKLKTKHAIRSIILPLREATYVVGLKCCVTGLCDYGFDKWQQQRVGLCKVISTYDMERLLSVLQQTNDERAKAQGITVLQNSHQQVNKNVESGRTQNVVNTGLTKAMTTMDEFKCGFPSGGLSVTSNKWWGNRDHDDCAGTNANGAKTLPEEKAGEEDKIEHETGKTETPHGSSLLKAVRKRAVEDGREALKLGVFGGYGAKKISKREKILLHQIFGSSLPKS
ncbi:unnamed protein product [Sphenostylis stenocarpa]|uniref:Uncharacterized protein n=1 Tax=Sphenostylis stenocarpa TaxID=92480 RepID=A0AA86VZH0_9FABA|nr:unnamed protein product [Sphenostylis stenocarpa]